MTSGISDRTNDPIEQDRAEVDSPPALQPPRAVVSPSRRRRWRISFSYRVSLIFSISLLVVATGLTLSLLAFRAARASTTALAHSLFQEVSDHAVTKTRDFLQRAEPIAASLGNLSDLGLATSEPDRLARQLTAFLQANPGISWISYSDESGSFVGAYRTPAGTLRVNQSRIVDGRTALIEHDVLADGSWKVFRQEADSGYDPRQRPFYQRAKQAGQLVWLAPYIFYEQSVPGITCATPLKDKAGEFQGVVTVDFDLNTLSQFVQQLSVSPHSRLFIMTSEDVLLAHPTHRLEVRTGQRDRGELMKVKDVNDPLIETFAAQLRPEDRAASGSAAHARQFDFQDQDIPYYARATAFSIDGQQVWIVGAMAPQSDFLSAVNRSNTLSLAASLAALLAAVALAMYLAKHVSDPILALASFLRTVGSGDLTSRADLKGAREFRQLSTALNQMVAGLRDRMRLRTSLAVAMEVQQKLLPTNPPEVEGLDIAGFSAYCDETGGDYYDYLVLDKADSTSVLVAIGDVMGHGIAAALLMASARAILHSKATTCGHLGELLTHLNDLLVADMMGGRFMTMHLWCIDAKRRTASWSSAGHDPAMIYDPQTDRFDETEIGGLPLGIESAVVYDEHTYAPLRAGQIILLGTDGVWETANGEGEMFGKDRLRQSLRAAAGGSAWEIAAAISRDLNAFRGGVRQRDDITLIILKLQDRDGVSLVDL